MHHGRQLKRSAGLLLLCLTLLTATALTSTPAAAAGSYFPVSTAAVSCRSGVPSDVNGDGFAEVAVGEPGNHRGAGAVHVFYGQRSGLVFNATGTARDDQYFTQDTPGVPGKAEPSDEFGRDTALADLNGDGCADLVVGSPGESNGTGRLHVFYGSSTGLRTSGVQSFGMAGLFGSASSSADQELGDTLTTGDLNGDGFTDLAAGVTGLDLAAKESAGGVAILYGSGRGLILGPAKPALLTRDTPGVPGEAKPLAGFGSAVVTGDFNGDGKAELAIGSTNGLTGGDVQVVARTVNGFRGSQPIRHDSAGLPGADKRFCAFGFVLAGGDVQNDGRDDLAVADPAFGCHDEETDYGAGAVVLLPGSATGLTVAGSQIWTQDSPGVAGVARLGHVFGESLAMGPLDRGATADLVVGAPLDTPGGSVTLLLGGPGGLSTAGAGGTRFTQATAGIAGAAEGPDLFGNALSTAFVQSRDQASVAVGNPGETVGSVSAAGSVTQLSIGSSGPNPVGSRTFNAGTPGVQGQSGTEDEFGASTQRWG